MLAPYVADPDRYADRMPYRRCGKSGLKLPEISLGFWHNFGDGDDLVEGRKVMHTAFDHGITHFDFANNYGPPYGSAETNCGQILKRDFAAHRDEIIISTKAGHDMWPGPYGEWGSRKHVLASLDQSLARLQVDYVDIFYSHRPDPETPVEETVSALITAVQSGRALYVGFSKYPLETLQQAHTMLASAGIRTLIYQPPYSILNRFPEENGTHEWLANEGIGSIVFSPLAQGLLTDKYVSDIPTDSRAATGSIFLDETAVQNVRPTLIELQKIAQHLGIPLHQLALRWVLDQPAVTSALIGARTVEQLLGNIAATEVSPLDHATLTEIESIISQR